MSLIEQIQNDIVNPDNDLGAVLLKCKLLAARLDSELFGEWLHNESNGYPGEAELPDYRIWPVIIKGHFSGPFGSGSNNLIVPSLCLPKDLRVDLTIHRCRSSVTGIKQIIANGNNGVLVYSNDNLALLLGDKVIEGQSCVQAWVEIGIDYAVESLNAVRNRILDFALALEKEIPEVGERRASTNPEEKAAVTQIFNTTIHGGSMNLVGRADNSTVSQANVAGDFSSLRKKLGEMGIQADDIFSLEAAIAEEPTRDLGTGFGPKVSAWLGRMVEKASAGVLDVAVGVAVPVVHKAISSFYGW